MQHDGWLEVGYRMCLPATTFRNLGFSGDELTVRQRTQGFGTQDEWLTRCQADVIFAFFGYVESFAGPEGLEPFRAELERFVEHVQGQRYNGSEPPELILFSSIPFEDIGNPHLPDAAGENARIRPYNAVIEEVAQAKGVRFVDLFTTFQRFYSVHEEPLTINGIHLTEWGNRLLAESILDSLFGTRVDNGRGDAARALTLEKNDLWFNRYRATDGYNVYGGRSTLEYGGVTNAEVLQRELEVLDAMCAELDQRILAVMQDERFPGPGELPEQIPVATNRPGDGPDGEHLFLDGRDAIDQMTLGEGLAVNLYASEERFPSLVNPVQMSWDTRGRLWVAVWPTYPHWRPGTPRNDALLILIDEDQDGVADATKVFAGDLHNPTGFEFWNGGVFVANPPDILFLKDTDGDDVADERTRVLHGLSSADTHHAANSFVIGPDGALYFQEGIFHQSQIETIYGPMRSRDACAWRFDPRSWKVERYMAYGFLNPHGHVFDRWGQDFITDGTGNVNYYALPATGYLPQPEKHRGYFPFFQQRSRPASGTEILSSAHFPGEFQQNYLVANVIGFQGVFRYALEDDGSGFKARELEPIVHSADPRFRPSDLEVGPDGALYVLDWHNPLIGHMQHHLRDPSRDKAHGRVYRFTHEGRELSRPEDLTRLSELELVRRLESPEDRVRYRVRIELSGRGAETVQSAVSQRQAELDDARKDDRHSMLERVWVDLQHSSDAYYPYVYSRFLLGAGEPEAAAAAVRAMRRSRYLAERPQDLGPAVSHHGPRVRLAAVVALSDFAGTEHGAKATGLALRVLGQEMDRFLDYALEETLRALEPDWKPALISGELHFDEAEAEGLAHLLRRLEGAELLRMTPSAPVSQAILARPMLAARDYAHAAEVLARARRSDPCSELLEAIQRADASSGAHADHHVAELFDALDVACTDAHAGTIRHLAVEAKRPTTRRRATVCRMRDADAVIEAWDEAEANPATQFELLDAAPQVRDESARNVLFQRALSVASYPPNPNERSTLGRYVRIELPGEARTLTLAEVEVFSNGENVARSGTATQSSVAWGGAPERGIDGNTSGRYGDNGQTHTAEDRGDAWWEVDLGSEVSVDSIVIWNRTEGGFGKRLDGYVLSVLDGDRRSVFVHQGSEAPETKQAIQLAGPGLRMSRAALLALSSLRGPDEFVVRALVDRFDDAPLRASVVRAVRSTAIGDWPAAAREELAGKLAGVLAGAADDDLTTPAGRELLALAEELAPHVDFGDALLAATARRPLVLVLRPVRDRMLYDRDELTVQAGRAVELVFENVDIMPHNLVLTVPGALATVGKAAEAMASDKDAWERAYVPELDEVILATRLLQPGESQTLRFDAPDEPGDYPYVCTFPGHWVRMNGTLHVVAADAEVTNEEPQHDAGSAAPTRAFVKDWKTADFRRELRKLKNVDAERGRRIYEEATCILCHKIADDAGGITGPDMRQIARTNGLSEILTQVFEPSRRIAEGYATEIFTTTDGLVTSGRVLEETDELVLVQDDPYRDDGVELPKDEIEERTVSKVSAMPAGLLSTFEKHEILDLVAFIKTLKENER